MLSLPVGMAREDMVSEARHPNNDALVLDFSVRPGQPQTHDAASGWTAQPTSSAGQDGVAHLGVVVEEHEHITAGVDAARC